MPTGAVYDTLWSKNGGFIQAADQYEDFISGYSRFIQDWITAGRTKTVADPIAIVGSGIEIF